MIGKPLPIILGVKFWIGVALIGAIGTAGVFKYRSAQIVRHPPGTLVPEEPIQKPTSRRPFFSGRYRITPVADFKIRARILSKQPYPNEEDADLLPMDLLLGWGRMSDTAIIEQFRLSQSLRHGFVYFDGEPAIPFQEVTRQISNAHIAPNDPMISDLLKVVKVGEIVTLEGWLINATRADGYRQASSTVRTDWQGGACEIIWVNRVLWE